METSYERAKPYFANNVYKRGQFKGEAAPLRRRRDWWSRLEVSEYAAYAVIGPKGGSIPLVAAYPNGVVEFLTHRTGSQFVRLRIRDFMDYFGTFYAEIRSIRTGGLTQHIIVVRNKYGPRGSRTYKYYPGMRFDAGGTLVTAPRPYQKRTANRQQRKAFKKSIEAFLGVFPLLYGQVDRPDRRKRFMVDVATPYHVDNAEHWGNLIANVKFRSMWRSGGGR